MKTDVMPRDVKSQVAALAASVALAALATVGVAVSMNTTGDAARIEFARAEAAKAYADVPVATIEKTVVVGSMQTLTAWKAPVATTASKLVM